AVIAVISSITLVNSYALHHWPIWWWYSADLPIGVRFSSTLSNLNIDGNIGQYTLARDLIMAGAQRWNNIGTDFQLYQAYSGSHYVLAEPVDGTGNILALTTCNVSSGRINDCDTKYDTAELWSSNDNAVQLKILKYVAIHEFGHWVFFEDVGDDPGEHPYDPATTMVAWYDKNLMQAVQTHDSWSLKEVYP
ncbi:MAG: hypothetical protein D6752_06340, partial [Candidatus Nitrosothermus koennekii]